MSRRRKRCTSAWVFFRLQSSQEIPLSWHQALLLPRWVRRISSPIRTMGTPAESRFTARKFFTCRLRSASTAGSSEGPSTPQFQDSSWLEPSRFFSPFASLRFTW